MQNCMQVPKPSPLEHVLDHGCMFLIVMMIESSVTNETFRMVQESQPTIIFYFVCCSCAIHLLLGIFYYLNKIKAQKLTIRKIWFTG